MKRRLFVATSALILLASTIALAGNWRKLALWAGVIKPGPTADGKGALLPNGWKITPAGRHDHSVNVVDAEAGKVAESVNVGKVWAGMAMNPSTGAIFVSGGGAPS